MYNNLKAFFVYPNVTEDDGCYYAGPIDDTPVREWVIVAESKFEIEDRYTKSQRGWEEEKCLVKVVEAEGFELVFFETKGDAKSFYDYIIKSKEAYLCDVYEDEGTYYYPVAVAKED